MDKTQFPPQALATEAARLMLEAEMFLDARRFELARTVVGRAARVHERRKSDFPRAMG